MFMGTDDLIPRYDNERAVRILLECILVWYQFGQALVK